MGTPGKRISKAVRAEILRLKSLGLTCRVIALRSGLSDSAIRNACRASERKEAESAKTCDEERIRYPSGQTHKGVWIVCPDCNEGRIVSAYHARRPGSTGRCKDCSIEVAKRTAWHYDDC